MKNPLAHHSLAMLPVFSSTTFNNSAEITTGRQQFVAQLHFDNG
ncbi:hypothetical protein [Legionella jordanis]|nr:hypothetical protein [Legionella jordanis]